MRRRKPTLTLAERIDASLAREARLRRWLTRLERRASLAREARTDLPDALVIKMPFVREQLRLAIRKTTDLREQFAKGRSVT